MTSDAEHNGGSAFGRHLRTRMVSGLLVLIPLAITLFILNLFFSSLTAFMRPVMQPWLHELPESVLTAIALVCSVLAIYFTGLVTNHIVGRRIIHWGLGLLGYLVYLRMKADLPVASEPTEPEKPPLQPATNG